MVLYVIAKHKQLRDSKQKWRGNYAMSAKIKHGYLSNGGHSVLFLNNFGKYIQSSNRISEMFFLT